MTLGLAIHQIDKDQRRKAEIGGKVKQGTDFLQFCNLFDIFSMLISGDIGLTDHDKLHYHRHHSSYEKALHSVLHRHDILILSLDELSEEIEERGVEHNHEG